MSVIHGIWLQQEYYVIICLLDIFIHKLFPLLNQTLKLQEQTQQSISKTRINKIADYILKNLQDYINVIIVIVDADIIVAFLGNVPEKYKL